MTFVLLYFISLLLQITEACYFFNILTDAIDIIQLNLRKSNRKISKSQKIFRNIF